MDVKQEPEADEYFVPEIKMEEDSGDSKEKVVEEDIVLLQTSGRSCGDPGHEVKQELKGDTSGNWDAQLQEFLKTLQTPPSVEEMSQQPVSVSPAKAELQRQRFRMLSYKDASSPRDLCFQLQECCHQWLEPERHTKEQMLELVTLEQFLAILPLDMQSWVKKSGPETCVQAVTLVEEFLWRQPEGKASKLQVAKFSEEPCANSPKAKKVHILTHTENGCKGNEKLLKSAGCLSEDQERKPLVNSIDRMELPTMYMKTEQESDFVYQGKKEASEYQYKAEGRNRESKATGLDQLIQSQGVSEGIGLSATQEDNGVKYDKIGGKCHFFVHQDPEGLEEEPYRCWHCGEHFNSNGKLLTHERTHVGEKLYICYCCGESERIHVGLNPHRCSHCGNSFGCYPQGRIPGKEKSYTCSECGTSYSQRSDLLQHQRTHTEGDRCLSENQERKLLVNSIEQMVLPTMYMKIDQGKDFVYQRKKEANENQHKAEGRNGESKATGLDQFIQSQGISEGIGLPATQEDKNGVKYDKSGGKYHFIVQKDPEGHEEEPYRCWHCSKHFGSSVKLLNHERTHVGEKLYICSYCGESERIHAGQKPHKCSHCGTTFSCHPQEGLPGGEKSYTCSGCGTSYSQRPDLLQHWRTHTAEPKKDQENVGESVERPRAIKIEAGESAERPREIKIIEEEESVERPIEIKIVAEESVERPREIKREREEEDPPQTEELRKKQRLVRKTRSVKTKNLKPKNCSQKDCRTSLDCPLSSEAKNLQLTTVKQDEYSGTLDYERLGDFGVMAPKKAVETGKRKKEMILLEVKKEIIRKHEGGMRLTDLAKEYGRGASTIGTILKMKKKIIGRDAARGVTVVSKQRPPVLEEVEKLLLLWIEEKQRAGDTVTEVTICEKAKALHADLLDQQPGTSGDAEGFKASRGWFERFKARSGIHGVVRHGEALGSNVAAAEEFASEFLEVMVSEGYLPQQVFNCDETWLFWKGMPKCTFVMEEETSLPGHRLTLLLCANASGDLKIKPLLVYHSENPRAFKKHKVKKEQLSVLWRSSPRAWVTRLLFVQWVNLVFGPAVKKYLLDNNLPLKAMLLMDNAPAHPPSLKEDLLEDFKFITFVFLPPNITPLLQPMEQQVISNFKKLYTRELFQQCFEMTNRSSITLHEFWRSHFDIVSCLQIITNAWAGVSQRSLNSAWRNLWPGCVVMPGPDSSAPAPESTVMEEIVSLGRTIGLEVTEEDVCKLVEGHVHELTTEDLLELQKETMEEQISFEDGETNEKHLYSRELKEACQMWAHLKTFVWLHHPDKALAQRLVNSFDTDIMSPFQGMLKRRQWQRTMKRFLLKQPRHEEVPACVSAAQLPRY